MRSNGLKSGKEHACSSSGSSDGSITLSWRPLFLPSSSCSPYALFQRHGDGVSSPSPSSQSPVQSLAASIQQLSHPQHHRAAMVSILSCSSRPLQLKDLFSSSLCLDPDQFFRIWIPIVAIPMAGSFLKSRPPCSSAPSSLIWSSWPCLA